MSSRATDLVSWSKRTFFSFINNSTLLANDMLNTDEHRRIADPFLSPNSETTSLNVQLKAGYGIGSLGRVVVALSEKVFQ